MKRKRSMACLLMLVFLLVPLGVLANQLPFLPIYEGPMTEEIAKKRFLEMKALPKTDKRRIEFFRRSLENTGYTEQELSIIVAQGAIKVEECGTCDEMTYAMHPDGTSEINRRITPKESRTLIVIDKDNSKPWFVIRCVNPLKKNEPPPPPPPPQPNVVRRDPIACCTQGGPIPHESALIQGTESNLGYGWGATGVGIAGPPRFTYLFYPTKCKFSNSTTTIKGE